MQSKGGGDGSAKSGTSRLDKLALLLETGANKHVRDGASRQLAGIAEDRVRLGSRPLDEGQGQVYGLGLAYEEEIILLIARIIPHLSSKSWDTRVAAASCLGRIAAALPKWPKAKEMTLVQETRTTPDDLTEGQRALDSFCVPTLISKHPKLLASAGREFDVSTAEGIDAAAQRKELLKEMGLSAGDTGLADLELDESDIAAKVEGGVEPESAPAVVDNGENSKVKVEPRDDKLDTNGTEMDKLSARERQALKRKLKTSQKAVQPSSTGSPAKRLKVENESSGQNGDKKVVMGYGSKRPGDDSVKDMKEKEIPAFMQLGKQLMPPQGHWILTKVVDHLCGRSLLDPIWEIRHGCAAALRELIKACGQDGGVILDLEVQGHEAWTAKLINQLIGLLVLDRFGDFVGDTVVAPVRETAAQALGVLMSFASDETRQSAAKHLSVMISQDYLSSRIDGMEYSWQLRHAGLLGIKHFFAIASLQEDGLLKVHSEDSLLSSVFVGLRDSDDDVRAVAAATLVPIAEHLLKFDIKTTIKIVDALWKSLSEVQDDLVASTGFVMELMAKFCQNRNVLNHLKSSCNGSKIELATTLYAFLRHTLVNVRASVLSLLCALFLDENDKDTDSNLFQLVLQNILFEQEKGIRSASIDLWRLLINSSSPAMLSEILKKSLACWIDLSTSSLDKPIPTNLLYMLQRHQATANGDAKKRRTGEAHSIDAAIIAHDFSLISVEAVMDGQLAAYEELGYALTKVTEPEVESFVQIFTPRLQSSSASMRTGVYLILSASLLKISGEKTSPFSKALGKLITANLSSPSPPWDEMSSAEARLKRSFRILLDGLEKSSKSDLSAMRASLDRASSSSAFGELSDQIHLMVKSNKGVSTKTGSKAEKERERLKELKSELESFTKKSDEYEMRVRATEARALVVMMAIPAKPGAVVKGLMASIKAERYLPFQKISANAMALLLSMAGPPREMISNTISEKVLKNIKSFLCQDLEYTPLFKAELVSRSGITNLKSTPNVDAAIDPSHNLTDEKILFRGAHLTLTSCAQQFGRDVYKCLPKLAEMTIKQLEKPLLELTSDQDGQVIIDSLSVLSVLVPCLHKDLASDMASILNTLKQLAQSPFALIRASASRLLGVMAKSQPIVTIPFVVNSIIRPMEESTETIMRQGAVQVVQCIVESLDFDVLPYLILFIIPMLRRMSDPDQDVREVATATFASLVRLMALEAGTKMPDGMPVELEEQRQEQRAFVTQLLDASKAVHYQMPVQIKADLRPYQQDGLNWLVFLHRYGLHGILCDDMGLGKTLQTICIMASMHHERETLQKQNPEAKTKSLPSLVVCPSTLTRHWQHEILTYSGNLRPLLYTGNRDERVKLLRTFAKYDIIVASYESVRSDIQELSGLSFFYCVLDEGHVIKNPMTKLSQSIKLLKAEHRLLLSGTPIQNNVLELWSLFDFLMPGFLGSEKRFNERFSKPILASRDAKASSAKQVAGQKALDGLHKQVLPFVMRRLKEDVLHDLPPKILQDYFCDLTDLQRRMYDDFLEHEEGLRAPEQASEGKTGGLFSGLQYLRKLCNHPLLVVNDTHGTASLSKMKVSQDDLHSIEHSPKLQALRQLLLDCGIGHEQTEASQIKHETLDDTDQGLSPHRVLIFCQMKQMLDLIETDLFQKEINGVTWLRLDGSTPKDKRHDLVQRFNADPSIDVMLLTTSTGGLGLNLTGADTVIFVEHDWNPSKDLQAMDRAHRLGQKRTVNVYRLITRGTLEEKIMGLQKFKTHISSSVVNDQNRAMADMETDGVLDLLSLDLEASSTGQAKKDGRVSMKSILAEIEASSEQGGDYGDEFQ